MSKGQSVWDTDGGVYLGYQYDEPPVPEDKSLLEVPGKITARQHRNISTPKREADRHLLTIGPNGSGKTRRLLITNLYYLTGWSTLVVDPKGDLAVKTAAHRMNAGNEIITLDPFGVIERQHPGLVENLKDETGRCVLKSAGMNPIAALDPKSDDFPDDAKAIGEALIKVDSKDDAFWAKSAQALSAGLAMAIRVKGGPAASLHDLRELVGSAPEELGAVISNMLPDMPDGVDAIASKLNRYRKINSDDRTVMSILSNAQTATDWLDSKPIQRDLSRGAPAQIETITKGAMKNRPVTIYLILPPRYLETHATWLRLMITAILTPLIRTTGGKVPVLFMLDEFAQLGRLEVIERNMALMRGYGVKLWPIFQDLAQAQDVYEKRWESFISNAGVLQSFAPQDNTTREYLSKLSGQRLYWLKTAGTNTTQNTGPQSSISSGMNEGLTNISGPNFWPQGLAALDTGEAVLFARGRARRSYLPDPSEIEEVQAMLAAADLAAKAA